MPPQLTVGKYRPPPIGTSANSPYTFLGNQAPTGPARAPGAPGPQYGGQWMYPGGGGYGGGAPGGGTTTAAPIPQIQLPTGTPGQAAYTPDYASMIGGSWEVGAAESAMGAQMAAARAAFQKNLRSNFIDLGYEGDLTAGGMGNFSKYIDKETIQKAIDNKYSSYAQIKQQQQKADAFNAAQMAASGMATSGLATETATDTLGQVEQARYEGLRNFLSGGEQGLSGLTTLKAQLAAGVAQARAAAASRLASMYPPTPAIAPTSPNWDDFWGSYTGGNWAMPGQGNGWIVPSGVPGDQGQAQPWWVGPGSGAGGSYWGSGPPTANW